MNKLTQHFLTTFAVLGLLIVVGGLAEVVWCWPTLVFWGLVSVAAGVIVATGLIVVYRSIFKSLEGIKINRSK